MMPRKFAEGTEVSVSRSRAELEDLLGRHGATATAIFNSTDSAAVAFEMNGRRIMMKLALPDRTAREFTHAKINQHAVEAPLSPEASRTRIEKASRQRWRSLLLAVKAKLVSVAEGVETFEDAFMAHVVMPDGRTVGEHARPSIASAYRENKMVPLLPYGGGA